MARLLLIATMLLLPPMASAAGGEVNGYCEYEGRRVDFVGGVAWPVFDEDSGEATGEQLLVFTTYALEDAAIWRAKTDDREDAVREQDQDSDDSARLQLTLQSAEGLVGQQYLWLSPGTNLSRSGSGIGQYRQTKAAAGRVAGKYTFSDEEDDPRCELQFDVALLGDAASAPPLPGRPLPAGGGEPGRVYLALNRALLAGDIEAIAKLLPPDKLAEMRKAQTQPEFAAQLEFMQALAARDIHLTGGREHGDRAWLEFTATEGGQPRVGSVEMARQDGRWYVVSESTRDPD